MTEQNRTEQNRTEPNRTEQNRTEQNRTEQLSDQSEICQAPQYGPLVSIVVPVYNAEKYLERCMDSLLCQTLHNIEILCVNDGSTDSSGAILNKYAKNDSRITVFNQENQGPGAARNTALDNAKGKYILFCDSDDTLEPEAAFECSEAMEKNQVDIVMFNTDIVEVDRSAITQKNVYGELILNVYPKDDAGVLNQKKWFKACLFPTVWKFCFRNALIKHYNLCFTHYKIGEDIIFLLLYFMIIKQGCFLHKKLYSHYTYKDSLTSVINKHPLLVRFISLLRTLWHTFTFAVNNKKPFKEFYVFYWLFMWLRNKILRQV
jgi:glycosyltransferase involved in cell wall biosynthesis